MDHEQQIIFALRSIAAEARHAARIMDREEDRVRLGQIAEGLEKRAMGGDMNAVPAWSMREVTDAMKRSGAQILKSRAHLPPEELVAQIYKAMASENDLMPGLGS